MVADLRRAAATPGFPPVLLVHPASVEAGAKFFAARWPQARAIADPQRVLFTAFARRRGSIREMFAPRVWIAGLRSLRKGHFAGLPKGDPFVLPGMFLVHDGGVVWQHEFRHPGDHPDLARLPQIAAGTA